MIFKKPLKVMFICAGNICRSPLAHAMFDKEVKERGFGHLFKTESSGTNGFHVGELPDPRTRRNAIRNGLEVSHIARRFEVTDLENWDLLLVMDESNYRSVIKHAKSEEQKHKVCMYRNWDHIDTGSSVPDPYLNGEESFEVVYQIVKRTTKNLVRDLKAKLES